VVKKAKKSSLNDQFGRSVAISGDFAVVGMYADDDKGNDSGSVYIFKCEQAPAVN
jgi:hypothetical protein